MEITSPPLPRFHQRTPVSVDVAIVGVLDSFDAQIADLSEGGALVIGGALPAKARCEIHYGGQIVFATVMWSESDRMGLRFPFELRDGPLHQRLVIARSHQQPRALAATMRGPGGFGRRGL
ncbi:MAG: PilZ domain-containing protein [Sphingopyxis sp.]|nr:PilZ domain-containing protein [Sphingopyxis sp.]